MKPANPLYWTINTFSCLLLLSVSSCNPKITQVVYKAYPAANDSSSVQLYQASEKPKKNAEVVSTLIATEANEDIMPEIISEMADSARKVGGQFIWLRDYEPNGTDKVYALALRERDIDTYRPINRPDRIDKKFKEEVLKSITEHRYIPILDVAYYQGAGKLTGHAYGMSSYGSLEKEMSKGKTRTIKFRNHPHSIVGWGVLYSEFDADGSYSTMSGEYHSMLIEPFCSFIFPIGSGKFMLTADVGIGYHHSKWSLTDSQITKYPVKATTYAPQFSVGMDYVIVPGIIISANASAVVARNREIIYNPTYADLPGGFGKNMDYLQASVGLRLYIPR